MRFYLLLLVVAVLILRPAELFPELENMPIYEVAILACLVCSVGPILGQFNSRSLTARPITVCVFGLLPLAVLSHLSHLATADAFASGFVALKVVVLYLLLVATLTSYARLRLFLAWVGLLIAALAVLALLQHHGQIDLPSLQPFQQKERDDMGNVESVLPRLCGPGIFHDPNDLCVILAVGVMIGLYRLGDQQRGWARFFWLGPLGAMGYAVALTHSRGGFLALLAGLLVLLTARLGRKGILLGVLALPVLFVLFGGRQTDFAINDKDDTSQTRIRLWSEGLVLVRESPLFGIGQGTFAEATGQVAHNSFVEAYTELGLLGGTIFLGAFLYALWGLARLRGRHGRALDPQMQRTSHYLLAMSAALVTGIFSLSRVFSPPTYVLLGLVTAYLRLAACSSPGLAPRLTGSLVARALVISCLALLSMHSFVVLFSRWS